MRLSLLPVLALAACGGAAAPAKPAPPPALPVEVLVVAERTLGQEVRAGGTLQPAEIRPATSRVAGVAETVSFRAGDVVQAGQALVEIEPERFRIAVERAGAALRKAEAQVDEMRASLDRRERLDAQGTGMVPAEEMVAWRSRLAQALADVALARAGLAQAQLDARDAVIRAPLPGVVESRTVQPGQYLTAGTVVATQVQRLPLRLSARVATAEAALLRVGQAAQVRTTAGTVLAGRLTLVGAAADAGSRTVEVVAEVAEAPPAVVAGCFAELIALGSDAVSRPAVPQAALRATERGYQGFVAVDEQGRTVARVRLVGVGLRTADGWIEARSGIAAGERMVVGGADSLRDGQAIDPRPSAAGR
jgi:multidrug efflux system membrane fusion protein